MDPTTDNRLFAAIYGHPTVTNALSMFMPAGLTDEQRQAMQPSQPLSSDLIRQLWAQQLNPYTRLNDEVVGQPAWDTGETNGPDQMGQYFGLIGRNPKGEYGI